MPAEELAELRGQLEEEAEFSAQAMERAQIAEADLVSVRSELAALKVPPTHHIYPYP